MISIYDIGDGFSDILYKEESIGILEPGNIARLNFSLEDCMNDEKELNEILQYRNEIPEIRQAVTKLGYNVVRQTSDIDQISIYDLRHEYDSCFY